MALLGRASNALAVTLLALACASVVAADKRTNSRPATTAAPRAASAPAAQPSTNGYRIASKPAWVVDVDAPTKAPTNPEGPGYRLLLSDVQTRLDAPGEQQQYIRSRVVATESAALAEVSKAELHFNPAYQTLTLHEAALWRDGVRQDRLNGARIELLRREER